MKIQNRGRRRRKLDRLDHFARAHDLPNRRAAWHWVRVLRLRELLNMGRLPDSDSFRRVIAIKGYYPAHRHLFTLREFADAVCASPKVIRAAERRGMIKSERLPGKKARKLFFTLAEIRRFLDGYGVLPAGAVTWLVPDTTPIPEELSRVFRSEKIALDPHLVRGDAVTIERVMLDLRISRRGVQYYLKRGDLKKIPCGHRTVLITRKSLERLHRRRVAKPERQFESAKKRLEKIRGCRIETKFVRAQG